MTRTLIWFLLAGPLAAQSVERLPLPVSGPAAAQAFEAAGPTAAVLTGFLVPSSGPLTSWAPVFKTLGADGSLTVGQSGAWNGPLPPRWTKVAREGFVVAGMRVLVRTGPGALQTQQLQVFWRGWRDGEPRGPVSESTVYGQAAAANDTVRIVELTVPENMVAVGMYGQLFAGAVVQTSLLVRPLASPSAAPTAQPLAGPGTPAAPTLQGPQAPAVPGLLKPVVSPLPNAR